MDALVDGGVMKRIDLAINDHTGILDIPELAEKCRKREYIGKSRSCLLYTSSDKVIRGGVKIQKRDLETGDTKPQGSATLKDTAFDIISLKDNAVLVEGCLLYTSRCV